MQGGPPLTYQECHVMFLDLGNDLSNAPEYDNHPFQARISRDIDIKLRVTVDKIPHQPLRFALGSSRFSGTVYPTRVLRSVDLERVLTQAIHAHDPDLQVPVPSWLRDSFERGNVVIVVYGIPEIPQSALTFGMLSSVLQELLNQYHITDRWAALDAFVGIEVSGGEIQDVLGVHIREKYPYERNDWTDNKNDTLVRNVA